MRGSSSKCLRAGFLEGKGNGGWLADIKGEADGFLYLYNFWVRVKGLVGRLGDGGGAEGEDGRKEGRMEGGGGRGQGGVGCGVCIYRFGGYMFHDLHSEC